MNMRKRILTTFVLVGSLVLPGLGLGTAHAYPPREMALELNVDQKIVTPLTGKLTVTIKNTFPGAVRIYKNDHFYKALNASSGFATSHFDKLTSGKYTFQAKSKYFYKGKLTTDDSKVSTVYVPLLKVPAHQKISKVATILVKYAPKGTPLVLTVNKKTLKTTMPKIELAKIKLPKKLLHKGKNQVTLTVGGHVKITRTITAKK
jgi:hypothetical protein